MKILIPTYIHPSENSYANIYLKNIVENLEKKTDVTCIWFLCHPQKLSKSDKFRGAKNPQKRSKSRLPGGSKMSRVQHMSSPAKLGQDSCCFVKKKDSWNLFFAWP